LRCRILCQEEGRAIRAPVANVRTWHELTVVAQRQVRQLTEALRTFAPSDGTV